MQLTPHFALEEFAGRAGARIPRGRRREYRELCEVYLEPMRRTWGRCRVHSGVRSVEHNERVGGAPRSMHVPQRGRSGVAADVSFATGSPSAWAAQANRLGVPGLGLYVTHVHLDTRDGHARW